MIYFVRKYTAYTYSEADILQMQHFFIDNIFA